MTFLCIFGYFWTLLLDMLLVFPDVRHPMYSLKCGIIVWEFHQFGSLPRTTFLKLSSWKNLKLVSHEFPLKENLPAKKLLKYGVDEHVNNYPIFNFKQYC